MVDLITVPPVFYMVLFPDQTAGKGVAFLRFSRIMKFARVLRLLRILKSVTAVTSVTQDAIRNQFITFVSLCLSLVICTTGFVHFIGNELEAYPGAWGSHQGTYIYILIHIDTHACHAYVCVSVYMCVWLWLCVRVYVCVCLCWWFCMYAYVYLRTPCAYSTSQYIYMHIQYFMCP